MRCQRKFRGELRLMGFMDKLKTGASNTNNALEQSSKESEFNSKINDQKKQKAKLIADAGEKVFAAYLEGKTELSDEVKDMYEKCKACDAEVEKLEKEKADMIADYEAQREAKREELRQKEAEEKAAKEAAKAEKEKEKAAKKE